MTHCLLLRLQLANKLITLYPGRLPWAIILLGLRPATARNHDCCNTRYYLYSLDALPAATEFFEIIRHVRVVPCHSVAMIRNVTSVSSQQQFRDLHLSKRFRQQRRAGSPTSVYHVTTTLGRCYQNLRCLHFSKDGLKAQKVNSPEQRSGYS